jgi:hypothetical protein
MKKKTKKTKREKKKLKWMPGSGRAQPGPAAAEGCGTERMDAG